MSCNKINTCFRYGTDYQDRLLSFPNGIAGLSNFRYEITQRETVINLTVGNGLEIIGEKVCIQGDALESLLPDAYETVFWLDINGQTRDLFSEQLEISADKCDCQNLYNLAFTIIPVDIEETVTEIRLNFDDLTPEQQLALTGPKGDKPAHEWNGTSLSFENPDGSMGESVNLKGQKGDKGETGDPFTIYKSYPTIVAMESDFANVPDGSFVAISSNEEDPDNAKLFLRGTNEFTFITDLSGAQGIKGDKGDRGEGYLGIITPSSTIPSTGSWYGTVLEAGTFNNVSPAITVNAADFDVENGTPNNEVRIIISEGVATKDVRRVKGEVGATIAKATDFAPDEDSEYQTGKTISDFLLDTIPQLGTEIPLTLTAVNSYVSATGTVVASANWRASELEAVTEGQERVYFGRTNISTSSRAVVGYDSAGTFVQVILGTGIDGTEGYPFTVPSGVGITQIRTCSYYDVPMKLYEKGEDLYRVKPELIDKRINLGLSWAAVGTSITWQDAKTYLGTPTGVSGLAKGYQTRVKEVFGFTAYSNYGYSGNALGGTEATSILATAKTNTWVSRDIFSLESITNDFKRNVPIGTITDYDTNTGIATYYGALRVFKDKIASLNPDAIIIVANALKRDNAGYTSTSANTQGHTLLDYEKALMTIARLNDWGYIDQYRESGIIDETLTQTTLDGLHPNDFGYRLISKVWIKEFWLLSKTNP